ncbi:hypothetical protein AZF37_01785 [endosymbiont 'TC1' of Trimyema compressum]|uniref:alpha/beta hydrolase n=1 Tax=endosymbiont 'TC1' of Trimyema compressum TaxID=243899 RepID=UPI0007F12F21|nr:alpha/beta fold hydrolase [endosymbiont 'TC1' of Trimyema compressum]AMP20074.1 hypothetical protein AZF37_01785 [endosymbiont 'TC1' of Trimyema compressum]
MNIIINLFLVSLLFILAFIIIFLAYRKYRQKKIITYTNSNSIIANNGISELRKVVLNNSEQYIYIEATDKNKPVVLFLHGGPGIAYPFGVNSRGIYPEITENAVAVYWDQRGAGKSYNKNVNVADLTIEQIVNDTNALVDYLCKEFNRSKIFIVGASWGTIPAIKLIQQYPQKFYGYIAYAQLLNMDKGDLDTYTWLLETIKKKKRNSSVKANRVSTL